MSKTEKPNEEQVFKKEVSDDELEAVAGGGESICGAVASAEQNNSGWDSDSKHCVNHHYRDIYDGGFPNCAASVEDGSWCDTNDACTFQAVNYQGMDDCTKAHA